MRFAKSFVAMATFTVTATSAMAYVTGQAYNGKSGLSFGFMHTEQGCSITDAGVSHKPTFCTMEQTGDATKKSGMVDAINQQLDYALTSPSTARVSVAYFSFSNKGVQKKLCELSSKGVSVRIFLDGGSPSAIDQIKTDVVQNTVCQDEKGRSNVYLSTLGGSTQGGQGGVWRLHHNKFLMIDPGNGQKVKLNFSSGNLSTFGTSLHLDHWVTLEAPPESNIVKAQKCVMEGLEAANKVAKNTQGMSLKEADYQISQTYISTREACFDSKNVVPRVNGGYTMAQIRAALQTEEIAPLFSPNNDSYVQKAFISSIETLKKGDYMYIAIQHFLHSGVKMALISAAQRGVDVRIIMDDDVHTGESEVPGVDQTIAEMEASAPSIQIRYAETNHNAGGNGAMMHNKLAILNGEMTFSGAGHYTNAALRNNWENFYFVVNRGVITEYSKYFKYLWDNSVDQIYAKTRGQVSGSSPRSLSPKFLKIAQ